MNDQNDNNPIEKRHYKGKSSSDIINFPVELRRGLLSPDANKEVLKMPISSARILFKILNDLSNDQFQTNNAKQRLQLSLFEADFKTEHNTYARFTFKVSDITPTDDYTNIKKGLEFLENLNRGWYKSVNSKGKPISSYGGVILDPNVSEGYISFLVSAFWLEKLVSIPKYNTVFFETAWALAKTKQLLFYLWLLEVPDNGTKVNFNKMQELYEYNYKSAKEYAKNVLKPIKIKLNNHSNKSFNYSIRGELIHIVPYYTNDVDLSIKKTTSEKQKVTQRLHYWKQRHGLSNNDIGVLRSLININPSVFSLFLKSYKRLVFNCREKGTKVTSYQGSDFIKIFQDEIISVYQNSSAGSVKKLRNAYPRIT